MTPTVYDSTSTNTKDRKKETTPVLLLYSSYDYVGAKTSTCCMTLPFGAETLSLSLSEERRSLKAESSRARTHQLFCEKVCLHFSHS